MSRSDWAAVLAAAVRTPLAVFAGVMVASLFAGVVDSGIAVVPFLQEALTGLKKRNNPLGFGWWLGDRLLMRCRLIGFGVPSSCAHRDT